MNLCQPLVCLRMLRLLTLGPSFIMGPFRVSGFTVEELEFRV